MPTERIFISPQEFRATNASDKITFSSSNQYFKTTNAGSFKVGGFDRAPFILGTNYQTDRLDAGGYLSVTPASYSEYAEIGVPFTNSVMKMCGPWYISSFDGKYAFTQVDNSFNSTGGTGVFIYAPGLPYTINGVTAPGTFTLVLGYTPFQGAIPLVWPINFDYSKPGVYRFGPKSFNTYTWYRAGTGEVYNTSSFNVNTIAWKPLSCFFTQATTNIDLVATV